MNAILNSVEWVKGAIARTTANRTVFRTAGAALDFGKKHADEGRQVTYSSEWLATIAHGPAYKVNDRISLRPCGPRARLFVVTVRPTPAWEESDDVRAARARTQAEAKEAKEREFFRSQGV